MLSLALVSSARAATYYIAPAGNDANVGTAALPWKTWSWAFGHSACGDALMVQDGTYTPAANGNFLLTKICSAAAPYSVQAQNERRALISGNGRAAPLYIQSSAYVNVTGLRVKNIDYSSGTQVSNVTVSASHHIALRRMVVTNNNRYFNTHVIQLTDTTDSLLEENELYWFHRHGIIFYRSDNNVARRNYCNARNYPGIPGGYNGTSGDNGTGDDCALSYPANGNLFENNISDGPMGKGFSVQALGRGRGNRFYGNIALNPIIGLGLDTRGSSVDTMPVDTDIRDMVVINAAAEAIRTRGAKNTTCKNCSAIAGRSDGFYNDVIPVQRGDGLYSFFCTNCLATGNTHRGFQVTADIQTWQINYPSSYGNGDNFNPDASHANIINELSEGVNPALGTCRAWVPDGSPLKRAGLNGADIGANVLYRYENGILTNKPLWDRTTGKFPCGAEIQGVNDVVGSSCVDVHTRLNVNTNGCPFPAGYGGSTPPPATDLNGDGITNVADVQLAVNQASGVSACSTGDINKDGACNVADVQLVINKALGL